VSKRAEALVLKSRKRGERADDYGREAGGETEQNKYFKTLTFGFIDNPKWLRLQLGSNSCQIQETCVHKKQEGLGG